MDKLKLVFWALTYSPKRIIKLIILIALICFVSFSCSAQLPTDSVKVSRIDLVGFAENSILLRNCDENFQLISTVLEKSNKLNEALKQDIETKIVVIGTMKVFSQQQAQKVATLTEINMKEQIKRKLWRNAFFVSAGVIILQTVLILK